MARRREVSVLVRKRKRLQERRQPDDVLLGKIRGQGELDLQVTPQLKDVFDELASRVSARQGVTADRLERVSLTHRDRRNARQRILPLQTRRMGAPSDNELTEPQIIDSLEQILGVSE